MGHLLLPALRERGHRVVALDINPLSPELADHCIEIVDASVLDTERLADLLRRHRPEHVFHLAAVLSTRAELDPMLAHAVNVDGTVGLMGLCADELTAAGRPPRFLYPSSIAVYGMPDARTKASAGAVRETEWNVPTGVYGCNKLYCELLGQYFSRDERAERRLDFRSIRFPGLISAETIPSGGTSDYAPEMIHAAARGEAYACFVRPETRMPFMTMVDAVSAFLDLASAPESDLTQRVYNIRAFSPSAAEIRDRVVDVFPDAEIGFEPDERRQAIVDSWPADVDDDRAREDWGFTPRHGLDAALRDYLLPALRERYGSKVAAPRTNPTHR
jgi:nucleoside-diphosphate-sugar epimerase